MKTLDEANERADKAEAAKDEAEEKAEEAKKSTSDAAIGERVKLTLDTIASASKIVKNFDSKGLVSPLEIKRAALAQLKPTRDWSGKSEPTSPPRSTPPRRTRRKPPTRMTTRALKRPRTASPAWQKT